MLSASAGMAAPVKIIFDTDIGNDVDDVLALSVLHALQSRGECELLAVTITKPDELAGPFVDAVNTFYGRPAIPIGFTHSGAQERAQQVPPAGGGQGRRQAPLPAPAQAQFGRAGGHGAACARSSAASPTARSCWCRSAISPTSPPCWTRRRMQHRR